MTDPRPAVPYHGRTEVNVDHLPRLRGRARWRLAAAVNRLPGMCWANLVSFALRSRRHPWQRQVLACRSDAARTGSCYCGRLRDPDGDVAWERHVADWNARHGIPGGTS